MALDALLDLVAPPRCCACGIGLERPERVLCSGCRGELPWLSGSRCLRCALPGHDGRPCPARDFAFDVAWSPLAHRGAAKAVVAALKFRAYIPVVDVMAAQLCATSPPEVWRDAILVPVPPHPARLRARGVDHTRLLTESAARRMRRPVARCLTRTGDGGRQLGRHRDERLSGGPTIGVHLPVPTAALLIDDVHTTGATLHACAAALKAGGAEWVGALTYTRAL